MIFNQPEKHNAVSYEMWLAVPKIMTAFESDPEVRVIVLAGAGEKAFVSGADISEFEKKRGSADAIKVYDAAGTAAHAAMDAASKPTISMIRGICIGGGLAITLSTDLRICSSDSVFAVPAARLGLGYRYSGIKRSSTSSARLPRRSSSRPAITAEDARIMGLVNRVVPPSISRLQNKIALHHLRQCASPSRPPSCHQRRRGGPDRRRFDVIDEAIKTASPARTTRGPACIHGERRPAFKGR